MITTLEKVKTILSITVSTHDALITELIPLVEDDYLSIRNKPFEQDESGEEVVIVYPTGAEMTAIDMIGFRLAKKYKKSGIKSESLGDYSVTFDMTNSKYGYPADIESRIRRYVTFV